MSEAFIAQNATSRSSSLEAKFRKLSLQGLFYIKGFSKSTVKQEREKHLTILITLKNYLGVKKFPMPNCNNLWKTSTRIPPSGCTTSVGTQRDSIIDGTEPAGSA